MAQPVWPLLVLGGLAMSWAADRGGPLVHHLDRDAVVTAGHAPGEVAVVATHPSQTSDAATLASLYQRRPPESFAGSDALTALALGPLVDGPDEARPGHLERTANVFKIKVMHTNVRRQSSELRKNVPWRPLVEIPLPPLGPGSYRVEVVWQSVETLAGAKALSEPIMKAAEFAISRPR